jgi:hypothetical protein
MAHGRMAGGGVNYAIFTLIDGLSLVLYYDSLRCILKNYVYLCILIYGPFHGHLESGFSCWIILRRVEQILPRRREPHGNLTACQVTACQYLICKAV